MDITLGRFIRLLVAIILIAFLGWFVYSLSTIITVLIISALMAYILDPVASYLEFRGLSRSQATIIIFLVFFILIGLIAWFLLPGLLIQLFSLHGSLNLEDTAGLSQNIKEYITQNFSFVNLENFDIDEKVRTTISLLTDELLSILTNLISIISYIVIVPFVVFFLLKDGRKMKKGFIQLIPNRHFEMILNVIHKTDQQLGWYLRGQFTEAFVVGLLSVLALWLLDVQYFIIIGVFAGLANMVPYVGPVAGAIPAVAVTIINGGTGVEIMYILIAFAIVQLIDNVLLQPLVLSKSVNLHPLIIVFAVLIGGQFFGILGMLLAVPAAGILKVTSKELYTGIRKYNRF